MALIEKKPLISYILWKFTLKGVVEPIFTTLGMLDEWMYGKAHLKTLKVHQSIVSLNNVRASWQDDLPWPFSPQRLHVLAGHISCILASFLWTPRLALIGRRFVCISRNTNTEYLKRWYYTGTNVAGFVCRCSSVVLRCHVNIHYILWLSKGHGSTCMWTWMLCQTHWSQAQ